MTTTGALKSEEEAEQRRVQKQRTWRMFGVGLAVRLVGVAFLWLGNGHDSWFRKGLVIVGLVLSIGGIGILRFLLISGFRKKKEPNQTPEPTAASGCGSS
jgi:Na+/melibiose symporter-like transporter